MGKAMFSLTSTEFVFWNHGYEFLKNDIFVYIIFEHCIYDHISI